MPLHVPLHEWAATRTEVAIRLPALCPARTAGLEGRKVEALLREPEGLRYRGFVLIRCCRSLLFSPHSYSSSSGRPAVGLSGVMTRCCFQGWAYITGSSTTYS